MSHTTSDPAAPIDRLLELTDRLAQEVDALSFAPPVACVYNPLIYARGPFSRYVASYLAGPAGRVLWLGMNPGPFGMAQTGVPFGAIPPVRDWMGIDCPVGQPPLVHPKRPIQGFACRRVEGSGKRLWELFARTWPVAADAFARHLVLNYCPLVFMNAAGANITPDKLPKPERQALFDCCDRALIGLIELLQPRALVGIGNFAAQRLAALPATTPARPIITVLHPSPASPRANQGWEAEVRAVLEPLELWP